VENWKAIPCRGELKIEFELGGIRHENVATVRKEAEFVGPSGDYSGINASPGEEGRSEAAPK